jgi:hypothetical protein
MNRAVLVTTLAGLALVAAACGGASGAQPAGSAAAGSADAEPEFPALQVTATVGGVDYPIAIVDTGDALWALSHTSATWNRIDPATNKVTDKVGIGGPYAGGGTFVGGKLWALDHTRQAVTAVDPKSRKVVATIPVGLDGGWLVGGEGAEYAIGNDAHEVKRIDAATEKVTTLEIDPVCGNTPGVGGGFLWMVSWEGTLCKLDPENGKVLAKLDGFDAAFALEWAADRLLVPTQEGGVQVVDPVAMTLEATVPAPAIGTFQGMRYSLGTPGDNVGVLSDGQSAWVRYSGATVAHLDLTGDPALTVYAGLPTGTDAAGMIKAHDSLWFSDVTGSAVVRVAIP